MNSDFSRHRFSKHFNQLSYLGMWSLEFSKPLYKNLYYVYHVFGIIFLFISIFVQLLDLYMVARNIRKVAYNLCTSAIVIGTSSKLTVLYKKMNILNNLRMNLWLDSKKYNDEEDISIQDYAFSQLKYITKWFYVAASLFLPVWLLTAYFSYLWGQRELPFPAYLPINTSADSQYVPALLYQTSCAVYILKLVIEVDLAMFSVILQMQAHYKILSKNILKLNELYWEEGEFLENSNCIEKREINKCLRKVITKKLLKTFILRQLELLEYMNVFENIYNLCMFIQIMGGSLLIVMNGLEVTTMVESVGIRIFYQAGYLALILVDIYFMCYHVTELETQCLNVGYAIYKTHWYKMDPELQKILYMIIIRSQKPPRITVGKFFKMDLNTYQEMLRITYSWLMLFRQLEMK